MRVLVTGSRNWTDYDSVLDALWEGLDPEDFPILVHGAAPGLDAIAASAAANLGWQVEAHPADWDRHGKAAGPIRNQEMVDLGADVCLAFPDAESRGTWDCIRRANRAGIKVIIYPEAK